jgi:hypothetical protein
MKVIVTSLRKFGMGVALAIATVVTGCGGVSSSEVSALKAQTRSTESAEQKVADLRAMKAAKESEVADKSAEKSALKDRLAATKFNLDN